MTEHQVSPFIDKSCRRRPCYTTITTTTTVTITILWSKQCLKCKFGAHELYVVWGFLSLDRNSEAPLWSRSRSTAGWSQNSLTHTIQRKYTKLQASTCSTNNRPQNSLPARIIVTEKHWNGTVLEKAQGTQYRRVPVKFDHWLENLIYQKRLCARMQWRH